MTLVTVVTLPISLRRNRQKMYRYCARAIRHRLKMPTLRKREKTEIDYTYVLLDVASHRVDRS